MKKLGVILSIVAGIAIGLVAVYFIVEQSFKSGDHYFDAYEYDE